MLWAALLLCSGALLVGNHLWLARRTPTRERPRGDRKPSWYGEAGAYPRVTPARDELPTLPWLRPESSVTRRPWP